MASIHYFSEDTQFKLPNSRPVSAWIKQVAALEGQAIEQLNFVFCSDKYLLQKNIEYLDHDTYTDILTFDNRDSPEGPIHADIFISVERVEDNSQKYAVKFEDELHRVIIHGVLHLIGYGDKLPAQKRLMRKKEDAYLSLRKTS